MDAYKQVLASKKIEYATSSAYVEPIEVTPPKIHDEVCSTAESSPKKRFSKKNLKLQMSAIPERQLTPSDCELSPILAPSTSKKRSAAGRNVRNAKKNKKEVNIHAIKFYIY